MKITCFLILLFLARTIYSQSIIGIWKTIDDKEHVEKSYVEIYESGGKVFGKVIKLLLKPADTNCDKCKGERKDKPVLGMVIMENMIKNNDGGYSKGRILDPESGNDYGCSIWLENGKPDELRVRGKHWTGLYRTQTWYRVK